MMRDAENRMDTASEIMQRTAHGATQYNQRMPESVFPEATKANYDKYRAASKPMFLKTDFDKLFCERW